MMFWLIIISIALIILIFISDSAKKNRDAQERVEITALSQSRAGAYADRLKRTSQDPSIINMTDNELRDFLQIHIRQNTIERKKISDFKKRRKFIIIGIAIGGLLIVSDFINKGMNGIIFTALILSLILLYSIYFYPKMKSNALDRKYRQMGLDPDELAIEI